MTDAQPSAPRPKITHEEMERRRRAVEKAAHSSAMEGARRDPRTDHIFDAFVRGDIEISDMIPMIKKALGDE
jgi:flagellar biosynthesis component FlhA